MIFPGETVRIGAQPYDWQGKLREEDDLYGVLLTITDLTTSKSEVTTPMTFDLESQEYAAYWTAPRAGRFRATVAVKGISDRMTSVEQRVIKVAEDPYGDTERIAAQVGMPRQFTGHGPPTAQNTSGSRPDDTYVDLDTGTVYLLES